MVTISNSTGRSSSGRVWLVRLLVILLGIWGISLLLSGTNHDTTRNGWSLRANQKGSTVMPLTQHKIIILQDNELAYMLPPKKVLGLLIFFHGCNHAAEDFFLLPEDRLVAVEVLKRGLAVLSITSHDRQTGCWSKDDVKELEQTKVIDNWMKRNNLSSSLPRIGMGASSGGAMAVWATKVLNLKAIASYIMAVDNTNDVPTAYIHMPRDTKTAERVKKQVNAHEKADIPTLELTLEPHALTEEVCMQRIPEFGKRQCKKLISSGMKKKLLDENQMVLKSGVRDWTRILLGELKLDDILNKQRNPDINFDGHSRIWAAVQEEIAVAYGHHEMSAEHVTQVLDFLMEHAGI